MNNPVPKPILAAEAIRDQDLLQPKRRESIQMSQFKRKDFRGKVPSLSPSIDPRSAYILSTLSRLEEMNARFAAQVVALRLAVEAKAHRAGRAMSARRPKGGGHE